MCRSVGASEIFLNFSVRMPTNHIFCDRSNERTVQISFPQLNPKNFRSKRPNWAFKNSVSSYSMYLSAKLQFTGVVLNLKILILSYRYRQLYLKKQKISPRKPLCQEILATETWRIQLPADTRGGLPTPPSARKISINTFGDSSRPTCYWFFAAVRTAPPQKKSVMIRTYDVKRPLCLQVSDTITAA